MDADCVLFERVSDQQGKVDGSFLFSGLLTNHIKRLWIFLSSGITCRLNVTM